MSYAAIAGGIGTGLVGGLGYGFGLRYGYERAFPAFQQGGPKGAAGVIGDDLKTLMSYILGGQESSGETMKAAIGGLKSVGITPTQSAIKKTLTKSESSSYVKQTSKARVNLANARNLLTKWKQTREYTLRMKKSLRGGAKRNEWAAKQREADKMIKTLTRQIEGLGRIVDSNCRSYR